MCKPHETPPGLCAESESKKSLQSPVLAPDLSPALEQTQVACCMKLRFWVTTVNLGGIESIYSPCLPWRSGDHIRMIGVTPTTTKNHFVVQEVNYSHTKGEIFSAVFYLLIVLFFSPKRIWSAGSIPEVLFLSHSPCSWKWRVPKVSYGNCWWVFVGDDGCVR